MKEKEWLYDADWLLSELRESGPHWAQVPDIPGIDGLTEISRGGQGVVYRGRRTGDGGEVAVKVLLDGLFAGEEKRTRFFREIETAALLRHDNIVSILDSGTTLDGAPFYVMEYVEGVTLDDPYLRLAGDVRGTLAIFAKICDAVHHAHQRGIIHRDLKPGNILVGADLNPKVTDFGLAKAIDEREGASSMSRTGQFLGSLAWASPEQIEESPERVDLRTDIYSLGALLYRLLTGRPPHPVSDNLRQTLNAITTDAPPRPSALNPTVPDDVDTIVLRCLAKEPDRRYPSVFEVGKEIRRFMAGEPIEAKQDRPLYLFRMFVARHKAASAAVSLLLLLLLLFAGTMAVLYRRTLKAEEATAAGLALARQEKEKAEEIGAFLRNMLASADPFVSPDPSLTVREVLDRATRRINENLTGQPETEAEIRTVISGAYYNLGYLDEAEEQEMKVLQILRALRGEEHPDLAKCYRVLGMILTDRRQAEEAETMLMKALAMARAAYGDDHPQAADCLLNLAELRQTQFRFPEALALYEEAFGIFLGTLGMNDVHTLTVLIQWSSLLINGGRMEEAEEKLDEVLEVIRAHPGEYAALESGVLLSLAMVRFNTSDLDGAERLLERAEQSQRAVFGEKHPRMAEILNYRGHVCRERKDYVQAESFYRSALKACEALSGRRSADGAHCLWNIAQALWNQGRIEEGEALFMETIQIRQEIYGADHPLVQAGLIQLGLLWQERSQWAAALACFEESLERAGSSARHDFFPVARTQALAGECLLHLGRFLESERILLKAFSAMKNASPQNPAHLKHVLETLVALYGAWEKPEKAAIYRSLLSKMETQNQ